MKKYCTKREVDPFSTTVIEVIEFLAELFYDKQLSYSTVNTAKCAISKLAKTVDGRNIGTDPDICTFMRGIFELRTPAPKVNKTWDTAILLEHFRSIPNNEELKLKELTKKLRPSSVV